MQIVSDRAMDLLPENREGLEISLVGLTLTLDGKSYESGVDIQPDEFYELLSRTSSFPTTSQPSAGQFAELYRNLAKTDPEILSIHISSGLSGTLAAGRIGAEMVPEANVRFYDTLTLSGAEGWHVEAAARAAKAGWPVERILALLEQVSAASETVFTVATMRYLVHGGRVSHLKGLLANVLDIKPIIAVDKVTGKYVQRGQARTLKQAILGLADQVQHRIAPGGAIRAQVLHANNPDGAQLLKERLDTLYRCAWLPTGAIAPVLGAHTGPGLVGLGFAPLAEYPELPV